MVLHDPELTFRIHANTGWHQHPGGIVPSQPGAAARFAGSADQPACSVEPKNLRLPATATDPSVSGLRRLVQPQQRPRNPSFQRRTTRCQPATNPLSRPIGERVRWKSQPDWVTNTGSFSSV